jgi:HPt (histidine-containing phosphotransfer) domain-containing protein
VISVLGVNFNLSFQTEANAEVVNIAGRQRMLSQRVAKSLGNVKARYINREPYDDQLAELQAATELFNRTIIAFKEGGATASTKSGEAYLDGIFVGEGFDAVEDAVTIWNPLYSSITQLTAQLPSDNESRSETDQIILTHLNDTQNYVDENINLLLKLMNDLTNFTESLANEAANQSRLIQTAGIIASLFCFSIILYLIFGQLRTADASALAARQETQQIFQTVDQGLFLIDKELNMGREHSKALESIFSSEVLEGQNLKQFLGNLVSTEDLEKVERYLNLLFDPHKKQRLLIDLNPLNQVAVQIDGDGQLQNKFLSFSFSRVVNKGKIIGVLSSVADITKEVLLGQKLEAETRRNEQQLEMISSLMGVDSDLLPEFLERSNETYTDLNDLLRTPSRTTSDFKGKADSMMALIHRIKGESAALGLDLISETCHQFENQIDRLVTNPHLSGDEFLS